jgi:hypothetical protein
MIYWTIIRRFGMYENVDFKEWNDEAIAEAGAEMSLWFFIRKSLVDFLE